MPVKGLRMSRCIKKPSKGSPCRLLVSVRTHCFYNMAFCAGVRKSVSAESVKRPCVGILDGPVRFGETGQSEEL